MLKIPPGGRFGGNTALGLQALQSNTTGFYNTASGNYTLFHNTTGSDNAASGFQALLNNTTGTNNTAAGYQALQNNTIGADNTAIGGVTLSSNTSGTGNTALGVGAMPNNTTGSFNVAVGYNAANYGGRETTSTSVPRQARLPTTASSGSRYLPDLVLRRGRDQRQPGERFKRGPGRDRHHYGPVGRWQLFRGRRHHRRDGGDGPDRGRTSGTVTLSVDTTKVPTLAGANNFAGSNTFTSNINMAESLLYQGSPALQFPGGSSVQNTALGLQALESNPSGNTNTATGFDALSADSTGSGNTANGTGARPKLHREQQHGHRGAGAELQHHRVLQHRHWA